MKFSTIIPVYNKQVTLRRALYSALDQVDIAHEDHQIIIIDDGSSDASLRLAKQLKLENQHRRIDICAQKNGGVSAARNRGVTLASYDLVTFLDADDTYAPNFLSEVKNTIDRFPSARVWATSYHFVNTSAGTKQLANFQGLTLHKYQLIDDFFLSAATGDLPITSSSVCIDKQSLLDVGGFPQGQQMGEDQYVWSLLALSYPLAICQQACANYYIETNGSLMQTEAPRHEMPYSVMLQENLDQNKIPCLLKNSVKIYITGHLFDLVRRNVSSGNFTNARQILQDPRAKVDTARSIVWKLRIALSRLKELLKSNQPIGA